MADGITLFFDTETTGFARYNLPADHVDQPHTVQLAAQLCKSNGDIISGMNLVVTPGVPIPAQASNVHGISDDHAKEFGVTPATAVGIFRHLYKRCDLLVGHNIKFDISIIQTLFARALDGTQFDKPTYCTMDEAKNILKLPPTAKMRASGFSKPKPPRLEECIKHFFDENLDGAHDAMVDVIACRRVYFKLKELEMANG